MKYKHQNYTSKFSYNQKVQNSKCPFTLRVEDANFTNGTFMYKCTFGKSKIYAGVYSEFELQEEK